MATSLDTTTSHDITTDAGFRAWVAAIHTALTAVGLVQTSDTGQVNTGTATTPAAEMASTTGQEYSIWRFDDAEQATNPIFIKLYFGRGDSAGQTRLFMGAGTGSDGSGNLTGASPVATTTSAGGADGTSGNRRILACFSDGRFVLWDTPDVTNTGTIVNVLFAVERMRDASGDFNGPWAFFGRAAAANQFIGNVYDGGWATPTFHHSYIPDQGDGELPVLAWWPEGYPAPLAAILITQIANAALGDTGNVEIDGVTVGMRALGTPSPMLASTGSYGTSALAGTSAFGSASALRVLVVYE